jgi:hypothetical protein
MAINENSKKEHVQVESAMRYFKVRNFSEYQHYKHRNPPWIRLYYRLLSDRLFFRLDDATKYLVIGLFLLASQNNNEIPLDEEWIRRELNFEGDFKWDLVLESKFIEPMGWDASEMLAGNEKNSSQSITDSSDSSEDTETEILSFSPKTQKGAIKEAIEVLNFWNTLPAVIHHRSLGANEKLIAKTLKKYSVEEIKQAAIRYSKVRENLGGRYREIYAWTIGEFLTRQNHYNVDRFISEQWELPFLSNGNGLKPARQESYLERIEKGGEIEPLSF